MFHADVNSGDRVRHSAVRENEISHLLNSGGGIGDGAHIRSRQRCLCVSVYNSDAVALPKGCAVQIPSGALYEPFPVTVCTDSSKPYGVLSTPLAVGQIGDMVVSGICTLSNEVYGQYATPQETAWVESASGVQVISGAMALLGAGGVSEKKTDATNSIKRVGNHWTVSAGYVRIGTADIWHDDVVTGDGNYLYAVAEYRDYAWRLFFYLASPIGNEPRKIIAEIRNGEPVILHEGGTIDIVGYVGD